MTSPGDRSGNRTDPQGHLPWPGARDPRTVPMVPTQLPGRGTPHSRADHGTDTGAERQAASSAARLDVGATLAGKNILLIGTTGFVGKVALSMLLHRYPEVGKVFCLVRPGAGATADERFFRKVATSPAFAPIREIHGDGTEAFLRSKVLAMAGDIGRPLCNFGDADFALFEQHGGLHVILNSAGLVSFTPPLESAVRINALGAKNVLDTARRAGARLVHVSTCYVAGCREGEVWEDEPVVGYFPRRNELYDRDFDAAAEVADCQRIIDHARERSHDRAHISLFRERAATYLRDQRRDPDDEDALKLGVARERKVWLNDVLTKFGMERAEHWGWTNTYTYTKSLGEQLILGDKTVISTVVRPAVVESSVRYPFAGWNEGFNTTAPLVYLIYKGHRRVPTGDDTALDVIPVDFVAAGMILATAAVLAGEHEPVYQLGSSDANRVTARRLTEMTGLAVRRHYKRKADAGEDRLRSRLRTRFEGGRVTMENFRMVSTPAIKKVADGLIDAIDHKLPRWGAPRVEAWSERARDELAKVSRFAGQVNDIVELFKPFNYDRDVTFRCDNTRALWQRVTDVDQEKLLWAPHLIDWRHYWIDVHFEGLKRHVFATLDEEFGPKPKTVYTYKELIELFEATVKLHKNRTALRLWPKASDGDRRREPVAYTYARLGELAWQGAAMLRQCGHVAGDRVMLMSENRPEWGISYFAILLAAGVAVPLDAQLTPAEVVNLARASGARSLVVSKKAAERLCGDAGIALPAEHEVANDRASNAADRDADSSQYSLAHSALAEYLRGHAQAQGFEAPAVMSFDELLQGGEDAEPAPRPSPKGDTVASILFTSGTTGQPKGVMLSHKNFTAMASKLSALFTLYRHDKLLSVLPLHHTFEFSAGFLMPLVHGASIDYLEEIDADSLGDALEVAGVTGMVGVPALWQLLERKVWKRFSDRGALVERAFEAIVDLNRRMRESLPWDVGTGRVMFFPVHRAFGGRLRLLISGGSALPPDTMKSFHGLGFNLFEGYGMTESAPVLTVTRPGDKLIPGSVGRPLPGIDVRIDQPDTAGVGEVIARGPNVMNGYYENPQATAETLVGGWLHTGDLGRFDDDGNLYIVGRKKEMILGASGENIYPDELEELYRDSPYIKELAVVGLPVSAGAATEPGNEQGGGLETVALLVVPDYEAKNDVPRDELRALVRDHIKKVSAELPLHKRAKVVHLWDRDLPKTSTRKVKRREVIRELTRLERAARGGADAKKAAEAATALTGGADARAGEWRWLHDLIADTAQRAKGSVVSETRLDELGYDSLMLSELAAALEAAGVSVPDATELTGLESVGDVEQWVARSGARARADKPRADRERRRQERSDAASSDDLVVPAPLVPLGRRTLAAGMRVLYERFLDTTVTGRAYIPPFGGYIVAANHASHLDTGLVKHALGDNGPALVALAAKDYFFDDPVRRMYFENFTNLVPMERHGSLRESLRLAGEVIRSGYILLIFPEGTRSDTGVMTDFKPSLGYLAMSNRCGILPMFLAGTHAAMAKGDMLPKRGTEVAAHVAPYLSYQQVAQLAAGRSRAEGYRAISRHVEAMIRRAAPTDQAWALGDAGLTPKDSDADPHGETPAGAEGGARDQGV